MRLGGGGLNPAVVESHNVGLTPDPEEVRAARAVLAEYEALERCGEAWREIEGRVIDRYEAQRARETLDWAELCAARDREKAEAVNRVHAGAGR
jgi:citrate lyase beta subunit